MHVQMRMAGPCRTTWKPIAGWKRKTDKYDRLVREGELIWEAQPLWNVEGKEGCGLVAKEDGEWWITGRKQ